MANYPTSDPSFPTRSNGQTIDASHINVVGDEVVAIGSALRGTISHGITLGSTYNLSVGGGATISGPLQSSNSTVANLSVTGNSSIGGTLTFGGVLTASSGIAVSTGVVRQNSLPAWDVFHSTHVTVNSGSTSGVVFDSQGFVRGNIEHSTATNSSRVTCNTTGLYHVEYGSLIASPAGGSARMYLQFNDANPILQAAMEADANAIVRTGSRSGLVRVSDTGYFTLVVVSSNGASTFGSSAVADAYRFSGYFVG